MAPEGRFADYILFERVAITAFGDRFRAGKISDDAVEQHVLLQLFNGPSLDREAFWLLVSDRQRLQQTLSDPHLGKCLAFSCFEGTPFAAYSFHPGRSLGLFLTAAHEQKLPVPLDQGLFILDRAALALTAAYGVLHRGRPILHGFLVPDLMRLSGEGEIQVLGIEAAPGLRNQLSRHPAYVPYLAPEVRAGEPPAETDDVYSFGSLLYRLLCGSTLPSAASDSVLNGISEARLAATGETLPPVIANLLRDSLAPRAERIPNTVAWQQTLGRIILEGEHDPTTFNLSFLMHTVFRQELEQELSSLGPESAMRRIELQDADAPATGDQEMETETPHPDLAASVVTNAAQRSPFLSGLVLSFLAAFVIAAVYLFFFKSSSASADGDFATRLPTGERILIRPSDRDPRSEGRWPSGIAVASNIPLAIPEPPDPTSQEPPRTRLTTPSPQQVQRTPTEDSQQAVASTEFLEDNRQAQLTDRQRNAAAVDTARLGESPMSEDSAPVLVDVGTDSEAASARADDTPRSQTAEDLTLPRQPLLTISTSPQTATRAPSAGEGRKPLPSDSTSPSPSSDELEEAEPAPKAEDSPTTLLPPRLQSFPNPIYPSAARRLRRAATVKVRVLVDSEGKVRETELTGPKTGLGFDAAALSAAKRSRWTPATNDGEPVEAWAVLTIDFEP